MNTILVVQNILKPLGKLSLPVKQGHDRGGSLSGFFVFSDRMLNGGITHPLRMWMRQTQINVVNRACVSYLKFGAVTTLVGVVTNNLDKREHLSCG
jgi:hypothetical protein